MPSSTSTPRVWLITGSSSGFGRAVTEHALEQGDIVVATARKPEVLKELQARAPASKLLLLQLDVTKPEQIKAAFARAVHTFGRIDVVFNNAGTGLCSEVEDTPDEVARAHFEVNFWGEVHVTQEALRCFREVNKPMGGRLINMSSRAGHAGLPCLAFYSATRHAIEAVTQAAARELDPAWNIKITLLEPGTFRTQTVANSSYTKLCPAYEAPTTGAAIVREMFEPWFNGEAGFKMGDVKKAAKQIYRLSTLPEPPLRLPLGKDSIETIEDQLELIRADLEKYKSWSEDLMED